MSKQNTSLTEVPVSMIDRIRKSLADVFQDWDKVQLLISFVIILLSISTVFSM